MPEAGGDLPGCDICSQPAVYLDRSRGRHLCGTHLAADVEERTRSCIVAHDMVRDGDRIAVGLSGGKDSSALLLALSNIFSDAWDVHLIAVTVDEGIAGYREETVQSAVALTKKLGISHRIVSFESMFGMTLDAILAPGRRHPCTVCGILRKKALADIAREEQADSIATGHNLDDEAQSVLMNYLRGDPDRLTRTSSSRVNAGFIRRIKPFHEVTEKEVTLYGILNGLTTGLPECPYAHASFRSGVRTMQSSLEYAYPGSSLRLIRGRDSFSAVAGRRAGKKSISLCRTCGEPCSGTTCQACRLLAEISAEKGIDRSRPGT